MFCFLYHLKEDKQNTFFDDSQIAPTRELIAYFEKCVKLLEGPLESYHKKEDLVSIMRLTVDQHKFPLKVNNNILNRHTAIII